MPNAKKKTGGAKAGGTKMMMDQMPMHGAGKKTGMGGKKPGKC